LVATFDGALHLTPKNVVFSNETGIVPGDSFSSYLLFKNESGRTVQFALTDIRNALTTDPAALFMLSGLDVSVTIGNQTVYSGSYDQALGRASFWMTVAPGAQVPMTVAAGMRASSDNRFQDMTYRVDYQFDVRADDAPPMPGETTPTAPAPSRPPAGRLPKTGDSALAAGMLIALLLGLVGIILFALAVRRQYRYKKRKAALR
jgi:LPXTG-motif cell wall-anchored protein